ncbi:hypothetical protein RIF29_32831 [Crotalaria pallida]|uniref:MICOS complex subunit MIC10 n=1 Tax=Crotalaria pallida TaxID=3830 RepID=A0AAN9EJ75_CROPI
MGSKTKEEVDAKWDACVDLALRRFIYSSLAGAFGGLIFFRSRTSRLASVAFGGGVGIGSAYSHCSLLPLHNNNHHHHAPSPPHPHHHHHVSDDDHVPPLQNVQDPE